MFGSIAEAAKAAESEGKTIAQVALEMESRDQGRTVEDIRAAHHLERAPSNKGLPATCALRRAW